MRLLTRRTLPLVLLVACGGTAREVGPAPHEASGGVAARAPAPCPPPPALACAGGYEVAWDAAPRTTGSVATLVTRAGGSALVWSPQHGSGIHAVDRGINVARACAGVAADASASVAPLPGSDATFLVAAVAGPTVTAVVGVERGGQTADRYLPSKLLLWTDRGDGFGPPVRLSATVPLHVQVAAAAGPDGNLGVAWFDDERAETLRFALIDGQGAVARTSDLGKVRYGVDELDLVGLPADGWVVVQGGRAARELQATLVRADGTAGASRRIADAEPGDVALAWDGDAIAIAYETGDYGREASPKGYGSRSAAPGGTIGWGAKPDDHAIQLLRVAPDLTPLGPPLTLDRAADVSSPAALVHQGGAYWLAGATMGPSPRRPMSPQLVRFTRDGTITHRVPLSLPTLPWRASLLVEGAAVRGTITSGQRELRPFTLRCAPS